MTWSSVIQLRLGMSLVAILGCAGSAYAAENNLPPVAKEYDMAALGRIAQASRVPILIEFAMVHCEYCKHLEADYLQPMSQNVEYKSKVLIRRVIIDEERDLRDFNGELISIDKFSARYRAEVTPTVVVVDYKGMQIGKKLIGYSDNGFYGGSLDNLIDDALTHVRR